jgi:PAS domain S-box-containing protein
MGRRLALVIGNTKYEDKNLATLQAPDADIHNLSAILKDKNVGGFDDVITLHNANSTKTLREIAAFFKKKSRDDLLLLYFSGHGILDDQGRLYLAVKDTERDLPTATGIPSAFISDEMDRSRSNRQVLILDCCYSGAFARGAKRALGGNIGTKSIFEGTGYGRVVLTATDATQYAWEGDRVIGEAKNSLFTHYLIQGLKTGEADINSSGSVSIDELYDYIYEKVITEAPEQTPGKWSYRQHGEIIIARNPNPATSKGELPPELQQAIDNPLPDVRLGAISVLFKLSHGVHTDLARNALKALKRLADDDSQRVSETAKEFLLKYGKDPESKDIAKAKVKAKIEGVILANEKGIIEKFNTAAEKLFGYKTGEVVGKNLSILMPSPDSEQHDSYIANYLRTGEKKIIGLNREVQGKRKDGTVFPMDISIREAFFGKRRVFIANMQDITALKQAEHALQKALDDSRIRKVQPVEKVLDEPPPAEEKASTNGATQEIAETEVKEPDFVQPDKPDESPVSKKRSLRFALVAVGLIAVFSVVYWQFGKNNSRQIEPLRESVTNPAHQSALDAQGKAEQTRLQAVNSQANVFATEIFTSAKKNEEDAAKALAAKKYALAQSLFVLANDGYVHAFEKAADVIAGWRKGSEDARGKAVTARKNAIDRGANKLPGFNQAESEFKKGDSKEKNGQYQEAIVAFDLAENLFKTAASEASKKLPEKPRVDPTIAIAKSAADSAANARRNADNNQVKAYALEAYNFAENLQNSGRQYQTSKLYPKAIASFHQSVKAYQRAFYEKKKLEHAEKFYRQGDYDSSLEEIDEVFADPPYPGKNKKAGKLREAVKESKQNLEKIIGEARAQADAGNLLQGWNLLNTVPARDKNSSVVNTTKERILAMDRTPPKFQYDPKKTYTPKKPIVLTITVQDDLKVNLVTLHFKKAKDGTGFQSTPMEENGNGVFEYAISPDFHDNKEIEYYFSATDLAGKKAELYESGKKPFKIKRKIVTSPRGR